MTTHPARPAAVLTATALLLMQALARAEEPRHATEPDVLRESAEVVAVVDAFDGQDYFDANISLGFVQTWKTATITRETHISQPEFSAGGFTAGNLEVARYTQATSRLNTRVDIGVFQEVGLYGRLPLVLSDVRQLDGLGSSVAGQALVLEGAPGEQLFSLPFKSPTRSGVEYLAAGLRFSPMSQIRDAAKPTWTISVEGRFSIGEPLHACNSAPADGEQPCANPGDVARDGRPAESALEAARFSKTRNPGVSRGTTALAFDSTLSKRMRFIEPYVGIEGLFEFQNGSSDFGVGDVQGTLVNHPPFEGSLMVGVAVTPWEAVERFQRVELDVRFAGTYRSEGRDYSELFDAIGSSRAASLREPRFSEYQANIVDGVVDNETPSVANPNSEKVYTTGITDVQQHGIYKLSGQVTWLVGPFLKLNLGAAGSVVQGHLITLDQACNPNLQSDLSSAGPCHQMEGTAANGLLRASGIPNPNYREVLNSAGRRFRVNDALLLDAWLNATLTF